MTGALLSDASSMTVGRKRFTRAGPALSPLAPRPARPYLARNFSRPIADAKDP